MNLPADEILFAKLRPDAVIPTKRPEDAGYDIYPVLQDGDIYIMPHQTVKIHTGIISAFPQNYVAVLKERSSTGSRGLEQRCGVFDSGYRGEWIIPLTNGTDRQIAITNDPEKYLASMWDTFPASKAIAQALLLPLPETTSREVSVKEIQSISSERGEGGFGSTEK